MKRSHQLLALVVLLFAGAVVLRVWSHKGRARVELAPQPATQPHAPPAPVDLVRHPRVVPEEAEHGPQRIISLAPSITEIICALGMRDRLVGRTPYCTWPPGLDDVPVVGALLDTNYEKIKALRPDVVFITENSRQVMAALAQLGVRYATIPHNTLDDVYSAIESVGTHCQRPQTAALTVETIRADIERLRVDARRPGATPRRVLVLLGTLPVPPQAVFAAGPGSYLEGLLELAGHTNAAAEVLKVSHGEIPLEKLRFLDPEVILEFRDPIRPGEMQDLYQQWAPIGPLAAIRQQRVRSIGGMEWLSAGPRIAIELHCFIKVMSEFE